MCSECNWPIIKKIIFLLTLMYMPWINGHEFEYQSFYLQGIEESKKQTIRHLEKKISQTKFDFNNSDSIEVKNILRGKLNFYYLLQAYLINEFKKDYWIIPIETFDL